MVRGRSDGLTLIGLYHFVVGVMSVLLACSIVSLPLIVGAAAADSPDGGTAVLVTGLIALFAGGLSLLVGAGNLVVGWGLWQRREWARLAAIGLAILRLINVPLGTIIGGAIIWYLLQDEVKAEFSR